MMRVAFGASDATPLKPCNLGGYGTRNHVYDSVHDPIECKVLWIDNASGQICFISLDVIGFDQSFCETVRDQVCRSIQTPRDNIIVNAIHSHSSPMVGKGTKFYALQPDPDYESYAAKVCADTAINAHDHFHDAEVYLSRFEIDGIYSNRNDINRLADKWFYLIEFRQGQKTLMSYANISCHSTVLGPDNYACSGDLVGNLRRELEKRLGFSMLLTVGDAGDMSNRQYRQGNDFNELTRVVNAIADQVTANRDPKHIAMDHFAIKPFDYGIHYRMDQEKVSADIRAYEEKLKTAADYDSIKLIKAGIAAFQRKQHYDLVDFNINCLIVKFDDLEIVVIPGELVSKLGLELKKNSPKDCCIVQGYSNGSVGYIVEREEYGKAHESNASLIPIGEPEKMIAELSKEL